MLKSTYFSHDSNARHDPKCLKLIIKYGFEGYGIYWALNETMRSEKDTRIEFADLPSFSFDFKIDSNKLEEIIDYCITDCKLYKQDKEGFWSDRLKKDVEEIKERSEVGRENANKRWGKNRNNKDGEIMTLHDGTVALKYFGEWVDKNTKIKLDRSYYKELT